MFLIEGEQTPFPVGIYHGHQKPGSANELLGMFVEEASRWEINGITPRDLDLGFQILIFNLDAVDR